MMPAPPLREPGPGKRPRLQPGRVELLVFNVSHVDVVLGVLRAPGAASAGAAASVAGAGAGPDFGGGAREPESTVGVDRLFARPRFNRFYPVCKQVRESLESLGEASEVLRCPFEFTDDTGEQSDEEAASSAAELAARAKEAAPAGGAAAPAILPVGFGFDACPVREESWGNLHLKSHDEGGAAETASAPTVVSIMFPLFAQVLATWLELVEHADVELENTAMARRMVYIISGAGKPRNRELDIRSNSTKGASEILGLFVRRCFPGVETRQLDSGLGVFHYDQNVSFMNEVVLPAVEDLRHPLVEVYGDEWKKRMRLTIALTDGSPARLAALNASLRLYKPNYLHMWQLKTFYFEARFLRSDLLFQSFETMETKPPVPYDELDARLRALVDEMRTHKRKFAQAKAQRAVDELSTFWLRKTRKIVLAVLMVQGPSDEAPRFYRGMNLEVSMPTGSLCAERNVIGNALASEPGLRRQDLRCIAVLSMTLEPPPSAAIGHVSLAHTISGTATPQLLTPMSAAAPAEAPLLHKPAGSPDRNLLQQRRRPRSHSSADSVTSSSTLPPYAAAPPANKYPGELNPILPCGACNEWLKKIAEVNPTFKVMTFPNSDCLEAFIQEIAD